VVIINEKPYVVSLDVKALLRGWCSLYDFTLPPPSVFTFIRRDLFGMLCQIFPDVLFLQTDELREGIKLLTTQTTLPCVTMAPLFFRQDYYCGVTRTVNRNLEDSPTSAPVRQSSMERKAKEVALFLRGAREIALVDDVIFSGQQISEVISHLQNEGIKVSHVYAGIVIGEGKRRLERDFGLTPQGAYYFDEVIDEICERDFFPGVPQSGRSFAEDIEVGLPYILPFGLPTKWASIPEKWAYEFSRFCLNLTIALFEAVEEASNKPVRCSDLERKVFSLPTNRKRFVTELKKLL